MTSPHRPFKNDVTLVANSQSYEEVEPESEPMSKAKVPSSVSHAGKQPQWATLYSTGDDMTSRDGEFPKRIQLVQKSF